MRRGAVLWPMLCVSAFAGAALWWLVAGRAASGVEADALAALASARRFEPRIAGVTAHDAIQPTIDATGQMALARLQAVAEKTTSRAAASRLFAIAHLYLGETDRAIDLLRDAVGEPTVAAAAWCDLAAASLIRNQPTDRLAALDAARRGLASTPGIDACAFNHALALERVGLLELAQEAWQRVIDTAGPGWREEARTHVDTLTARRRALAAELSLDDLLTADGDALANRVAPAVDMTRRLFEDELIPRIGATCRQDRVACLAIVGKAQTIAQALTAASPDQQPARLAEQLTAWAAASNPPPQVLTPLERYGEARGFVELDDVSSARPIFESIAQQLAETVPALTANARFYHCVDAYYNSAHAQARDCLRDLDRIADASGFIYLRGRIQWMLAQVNLIEANFVPALQAFDRTLALMRQANDANQIAAVESLKATLLDQLGETDDAWQHRVNALTRAQLPPRRRHTLLNSAARSCLLQRLPWAALDFQEQAVRNAQQWQRPGALVESFVNRSQVWRALDGLPQANADLVQARRHLAAVADVQARQRFDVELTVSEGELLSESAPERALPVLRDALAEISATRFGLLSVRLWQALGAAFDRLGRSAEAIDAYTRGISTLEQQRQSLPSLQQAQRLDVVWELYERLIARQLAQDPTGLTALDTVEASRARLLDAAADRSDAERVSSLARQLPANVVVVYFSVSERQTVRWTISATGVTMDRFAIAREALDRRVVALRRALQEGAHVASSPAVSSSPVSQAPSLFSMIVPSSSLLPPDATLVVIPDGPLHQVPLAALRDERDRAATYLIERHTVVVAPSLRLFLSASESARVRFRTLNRAIVVEGVSGAASGTSALPALPRAAQEVRRAAAAYPHADILAGAEATPARFLASVGGYPVVHFAGHAAANRNEPGLSRLFLAPGATDNGWLLLRTLESASFARTALVVLSACDTGVGPIFRGEGVVNLARPFLRKGVPAVVNTLWAIDDAASARLLERFHDRVAAGVAPPLALQQAQREAIARGGAADVSTWAAFQYVGGINIKTAKGST